MFGSLSQHSSPTTPIQGVIRPTQPQNGHEHKYAIQMAAQGRGHALFDPGPGDHGQRSDPESTTGSYVPNPRVGIGDVGHVVQGSFRLLFNIHRRANDAQQIHGVPDGFEPLERREHLIDRRLWPFPRLMHSSSSVATDISAEASVPGAASFSSSWSMERKRGASLAYFDRHEVWDARDKERYRRYFRENFKSWLEFTNSLELGLTLRDLILVTGCDRTRAWATLWSEKHSSGGSISLEVQTLSGPSIKLTGSVKWHAERSVPSLSGPPPDELSSSTRELLAKIGHGGIDASDRSMANIQPKPQLPDSPVQSLITVPADQCTFIRGFQGRERFVVTPFRLRGGGKQTQVVSSGTSGGSKSKMLTEKTGPKVPSGGSWYSASVGPNENEMRADIEEVLGSPSSTANSLVSVALDIVAKRYDPTCENNILIMHDSELVKYLPEPGGEEHALWNDFESVQMYLDNRLSVEPPECLKRQGKSWVQREEGA